MKMLTNHSQGTYIYNQENYIEVYLSSMVPGKPPISRNAAIYWRNRGLHFSISF